MIPIAKPYPECTSGNPTDRHTIPGRAATLAICFIPGRKPPTAPGRHALRSSSNIRRSNVLFT